MKTKLITYLFYSYSVKCPSLLLTLRVVLASVFKMITFRLHHAPWILSLSASIACICPSAQDLITLNQFLGFSYIEVTMSRAPVSEDADTGLAGDGYHARNHLEGQPVQEI